MKLKQALLHNTAWKIIAMLFTFISNIIIVRLLGVKDSGTFFYILALLTLAITAMKLGIENGIMYLASRFPGKTGTLLYFLLPLVIIQSIIALFVLRYLLSETYLIPALLGAGFIISNIFFYYITAFYQARKMFISINVINTFVAVVQTIALALILFSGRVQIMLPGSMINILGILTITTVIQMILLLVYFYGQHSNEIKFTRPGLNLTKQLFQYSGLNYLVTIVFFLITRVDFFFVEKYCDSITFGNYTQVAKFGQMALVLPGLLGGVIFPYSTSRLNPIEEQVSLLCRLLGLFFIILFTGLLLVGRWLFPWMLGDDFTLVYNGLLASFPGIYSMGISILLLSYFQGKNRQSVVLASYVISLIVLMVGDYFLVPKYGYLAAAAVFSISNLIGMLILLRHFIKRSNLSWARVLIFSTGDLRRIKL